VRGLATINPNGCALQYHKLSKDTALKSLSKDTALKSLADLQPRGQSSCG